MDEKLRNRVIIILSALTLIFFVLNISSCIGAYNQNAGRKKEMLLRMDLEERMSKFNQEKEVLVEKLKAKDKELDEAKVGLLETKKLLTQEELISQSLKEDLQKVSKLKEALEANLQQELTSNKKAKK